MVLLYLVAGSVLFCFGFAEDVVYDEGHSQDNYPDPMFNFVACGRKALSYICDPNHIISESEADQLNKYLAETASQLHCPCSRYSCLHHNQGYKIGIALTRKIIPSKPLDELSGQELSESEWEEKRQEWLLDEAASFAHKLLGSWRLDTRCTEAVIVLYSLRDGVLYTAVGDVARMKLNSTVVYDVSRHVRPQFGRGGSIFKGLFKMVKDYRSVFQGTYEMGKPMAKQRRSSAVSVTKLRGSAAAAVMLLLSVFSMLLCHITVGGSP